MRCHMLVFTISHKIRTDDVQQMWKFIFFNDKRKYLEINLFVLIILMKIEKQFGNVNFGILSSSSFSKGFGIEVSWVSSVFFKVC